MDCAFGDELLTRWKLLTIFEPEKEAVRDAYLAVLIHRTSCGVCKDEHRNTLAERTHRGPQCGITVVGDDRCVGAGDIDPEAVLR